jgi:hypothetical protein
MDIKEYILAAAELELGDELYIPCQTRQSRKKTLTKVRNVADEYKTLVNTDVNFHIKAEFKDGKYWVMIRKIPVERAFFVKNVLEGKLQKKIADDPNLRRIIKCMREDKIPEEDIRAYVEKYRKN